ncbi:MAG: cyclic nucleotide-binding domain-containing protein [Polyangiaceae bacterium]|nr:cyclic nucleotide-binding domain-containing protein [Polyangiaceae bacterium]
MTLAAADLRHLPLFRSLSDDQLKALLAALSPRKIARGQVLFSAGDIPSAFQILSQGEVELVEGSEPRIVLRPGAPIGELGALTGLPRNATATALTDVTVLEVKTDSLMKLFMKSSDLAFSFYKSLLEVVSEKVNRDKLRMDDMRRNIIRTQKAMKELRELVLSAEETTISQPLCDKLDDLIEHNRRSHYRVVPLESHPAFVRIEGNGAKPGSAGLPIVELSEGFLKIGPEPKLESGMEVVGVLKLPKGELPVSGRVERSGPDGVLVKLDTLIDQYAASMRGYIVELQMLDFVV